MGSVADIYDGQFASSKADQVRVALAFEPLVHYDRNGELSYEHGVAEAVDVLAADRYRITLKTEARFSNGESVTANDVVYSIRRRADPESLAHHPALSAILDGAVVEAADDTSVDVTLAAGNITFLDELAESSMTVVPAGYDRYTGDPTAQIGSGPFVLAQFEPGVRSVHRRNEDYWWDPDLPYLDEVHVIDYPDQTALLNALTGHEVDAIIDVPYDRAAEVAALEGLTLLDAPTGSWVTITMAVDQAPFDNPDVRRAMRLLTDRQQLIDIVLHGHGSIANDLYSPLDRDYAGDLAQHPFDPDTARELLKNAGHDTLALELFTPDDTPGLVDLANTFAQQAAEAGVEITVVTLAGTEYWGNDYTRRTFATDYWPTRPYLSQVALSSLPTSPYNTTHWPDRSTESFTDLYQESITASSDQDRREVTHAMQQAEWERGGHIIPFFHHLVDAYASDVNGFVSRPSRLNLDHYGRGMKAIWIDRQ